MNNLKYSNGSATYVESLEKKIAELEKQIVAIEMNNEPVAWMQEFECSKTGQKRRRLEFEQIGIDDIPLYTHQYERPHNTVLVPCDKLAEMQAEIKALKAHLVKKLTDEEIRHIQAQCHLKDVGYDGFIMRFARAILLKAQEV